MIRACLLLIIVYACNIPPLHQSITSLLFSFTKELDISGRFLSQSIDWAFTIQESSWIRISAEPKLAEISLSLIKDGLELQSSHCGHLRQALLTSHLPSGSYTIKFSSNPIPFQESFNTLDCNQPNLYLNLALSPAAFLQDIHLPNLNKGLPDITEINKNLQQLLPFSKTFESFSIGSESLSKKNLGKINIKFPGIDERLKKVGYTGLWELFFSIHQNFLISGGLTMQINKEGEGFQAKGCLSGGCVSGSRSEKNSVNLHSIFAEGSFDINLYYKWSQVEAELIRPIGGIALTLHIKLIPVYKPTDRFTCEAGRLPHTLNHLLDIEGFLIYKDHIFVEFHALTMVTDFLIKRPSIIRVIATLPKGIEIKLSLQKYSQTNEIIISDAQNTMLSAVNIGKYALVVNSKFSFIDATEKTNCEVIGIKVGISPLHAVKETAVYYGLEECQENLKGISEFFEGLKERAAIEKIIDWGPGVSYYMMSIQRGRFEVEFEVENEMRMYAEVFSDFVMSGLEILVEQYKEDSVEKGSEVLNVKLAKGRYFFIVRLHREIEIGVEHSESLSIFNCVAFQLRIQLAQLERSNNLNLLCENDNYSLLPLSLNTIGRLGLENTPQSYLPKSVLFSTSVLLSNQPESISLFTEAESILRVIIESLYTPLTIILFKNSVIEKSEPPTQAPYISSLSATLAPHSSYSLKILWQGSEEYCPLFSILTEIIPKKRIRFSQTCREDLKLSRFVNQQALDRFSSYHMSDETDYSSIIYEPEFTYMQQSAPFEITFQVNITEASALVTGHLQSNFITSGLILLIKNDSEVIEWGSYKSSHRYQLDPIALAQGQYTMVIKESSKSQIPLCSTFSGSLVIENLGFWDDINNIIKHSIICEYPDQPETLQTSGQLVSDKLHWHKTLPIDLIRLATELCFIVTKAALFNVALSSQKGVKFVIDLVDQSRSYLEKSEDLIQSRIEPGEYCVVISYLFEFRVPKPQTCPGFEIDFELLPYDNYLSLIKQYTCIEGSRIDPVISVGEYKYIIKGELDVVIVIEIDEDSEVKIDLSYISALSGRLVSELLDSATTLMAVATQQENWQVIHSFLSKGGYFLRITAPSNINTICWPLHLSYTTKPSKACTASILPSALYTNDASLFGGPQHHDGSLSFSGYFKSNPDTSSELIKILAPSDLILRVLTISYAEMRIESALYNENSFHSPIAYSKNKSKFSSFVTYLPSQPEPYYLLLSFINDKIEECMNYELRIEIKPIDELGSVLECKASKDLEKLPKGFIEFDSNGYMGGDDFAIFGDWVIGDKLPEGVISKGKKDKKFVYEMKVSLKKPGYLSIATNYDFLTNDLSVELHKSVDTISVSTWRIPEITSRKFNMISEIQSLNLSIGEYKLLLKQGLSPNHLVQNFQSLHICFPFEFFIEFTSHSSSSPNILLMANPENLQDFNPLEKLIIYLTFQRVIKEELHPTDFWLTTESSQIYPIYVSRERNDLKVLRLQFKAEALRSGKCYTLVIGTDWVQDSGVRNYCTIECEECGRNEVLYEKEVKREFEVVGVREGKWVLQIGSLIAIVGFCAVWCLVRKRHYGFEPIPREEPDELDLEHNHGE